MGETICWGEVLWDMFPEGAVLGGAVSNVAFHLAQLGVAVELVSRVGDDELGRRALERLAHSGVGTSLVQIDRERPTGRVNVELIAGEPRYSLSTGGAWEHIELTDQARSALATAAFLCVGTLAQRNPQGQASLSRALAAIPTDCTVVVDANVRPVHLDHGWLERTLAAATVVKVNEAEAELIERELAHGDPLPWLHEELGVELVALTLGAQGCVLSRGGEIARHEGFGASIGGDNVGAGDAFVAVLVHGLAAGWDLEKIAESANRYAAFVASRRGATPTPPEPLLTSLRR